MKIIKLFLASSNELKEERDEFQKFINSKNNEWLSKNIFLKLIIWEDFLDSISQTSLQDEYNEAIRTCDIFVLLFFSKVGKFSQSEFESAFGQFKKTSKPDIYTYFKNDYIKTGDIVKEDIISLLDFKDKIAELKHYLTEYTSVEDLLLKFNKQLEKLSAKYNWENDPQDVLSNGGVLKQVKLFINQNKLDEAMLKLREVLKQNMEELAIWNDLKLHVGPPMHMVHDLIKMNFFDKSALTKLEFALSVTDKSFNDIKITKGEANDALEQAEKGLAILNSDLGLVANQKLGMYQIEIAKDGSPNFKLLDPNNNMLLRSEMFASTSALKNCIESVRRNSQEPNMFHSKARNSKYFFVLKAKNGQVIGMSHLYDTQEQVDEVIAQTAAIAKTARVVEVDG